MTVSEIKFLSSYFSFEKGCYDLEFSQWLMHLNNYLNKIIFKVADSKVHNNFLQLN